MSKYLHNEGGGGEKEGEFEMSWKPAILYMYESML